VNFEAEGEEQGHPNNTLCALQGVDVIRAS